MLTGDDPPAKGTAEMSIPEEKLRLLSSTIDSSINDGLEEEDRKGFVLVAFDVSERGSWCQYASNIHQDHASLMAQSLRDLADAIEDRRSPRNRMGIH